MLNAAVIGLGVGEQHLAGYEAHPESRPVAICDIDPAKLAEVSARHPGLRTTTDPDEILADPSIDVVSIASYDDAHFAQIEAALRAGKHVFAEKPVVVDEQHAMRVRELLEEHPSLRLSTNVPLRRSPRFIDLRERIQAGELGTLFHLEGDYDYGRRHKLTDGWRGDQPSYSVVLGGGVHIVDLLLWLSGERPDRVVSAVGNRIATAGTKFEDLDFVVATLTTPSGQVWKVSSNLGCVSPHFHGLRLYGTGATFVNGLPDATIFRPAAPPRGATPETISTPYPGVHKGDLIAPFIESIVTGEDHGVTAKDVFETLSVCFAIERALHEQRPVEVTWL